MNEEAIQDSYNVFVSQGYTKSIDEYKKLIATNPEALNDSYKAFASQGYGKSIDDYKKLMGIGSQPQVAAVKKKDIGVSSTQTPQRGTMASPSAGGSLATQKPIDEPKTIGSLIGIDPNSDFMKAGNWLNALMSKGTVSAMQFADNLIVSARKGLQEEGFFDDDIPDTNTPITDAMKKKATPKKGEILTLDPKYTKPQSDGGPLDPTPLIKGAANLYLKIINSTLPQDKKNVIIAALNLGDAEIKNKVKLLEKYQEEKLDKSLVTKVLGGISSMAPDLAVAALMKNPTAVEGKFAKWGAEVSKDAKPLIAKYVPKATKFIEEAVNAPFTKIMAAKGTAEGIANAEEGEDIVDAAIEGTLEGGAEGIYMHAIGVAAGGVMPKIAKVISKTGLDSKFATAIANPLANAGVFSTAKAIRTPIETGEFATAEELALEAGTGVGFSLLHAGSLYKTQNEANHFYDNVLKTDPLESFGRVINETKNNLELVYNPDLTPSQIIELESARDQLKKAIIKEPDLNNKKLLGDEALKIQNQLDAHSAIKGIVENKEAIIEAINTNENLSEEIKAEKTKKVAAIADYFDTSEFSLKKKELNTRINESQKKLDDAALAFTNLKKPSDRIQAKIEVEKRRQEVEDLNNELTDLITNKVKEDAVQIESTAEIPVQSETGVSETMEGRTPETKPEVVTEQTTKEKIDQARIDRRIKNKDLTKAEGSTFDEDMQLKNAKVGDEFNFEEYKDGEFKSYDTKVKEIVDGKIIFENGKTQDDISSYSNKTAEDAWFDKNYPELTLEKPKEGPPPMPEGFDVFAENKPTEEPTILDSQIPLKRETFEVELDNGATTTVEVTTKKDGSRDFVTKADGFTSEAQKINKDNTLSTEEYISKAYGEIKGEPKVEQGNDIMSPKMKEKLTPKQKAELGIEEPTNEIVLDIAAAEKRIAEEKGPPPMPEGFDVFAENKPTEEVAEAKPTEEVSTQKLTEEDLPGYDSMMTKAEAIVKEKKRGRKEAEMYDAVMGYVTGSKAYETATDVQREALVRDVRKRFGLKEKTAPSANRLFGKIKDIAKVTITEKAGLVKQIKDLARGAKDAKIAIKNATQDLAAQLSELQKGGKINATQAKVIINKFSNVNVLSETSVRRFTDYMTKVFDNAEYSNELSNAKKTKTKISKLSRNKEKNASLKELGKEFSKIDPSMVDDIYSYNDIASKIEEAIEGSKIRGQKVNFADTVNIDEVIDFTNKALESQNEKLREERIAELQDLLGVDATDFSVEEIDALLKGEKTVTKDNEKIVRDTINKAFDVYSSIIKEVVKTGEDAFTGESVEFTKNQKELVGKFMDMDLNLLPPKEALSAVDALQNFLVNKSTAKMDAVVYEYQGIKGIKELTSKGLKSRELTKFGNKMFGRQLADKITSLPVVFEKMFPGLNRSGKVMNAIGITNLFNKRAASMSEGNKIVNDFVSKLYKKKANGEDYNTEYNITERALAAHSIRSLIGTEEQIQKEFNDRKILIEESIDVLSKGNDKEKKLSELYKKVYDKILKDSNNADDVLSKTDENNKEGINFWIDEYAKRYEQSADVSENIYNTKLDRDLNYTPLKYSKLSTDSQIVELDNDQSSFHGNNGSIVVPKTGSLNEIQRLSTLPKGKYVDLSFDRNMSNSMYDLLTDINTAGPIRQVQSALNAPEFDNLVPYANDRALLKGGKNKMGRIELYVKNIRNKSPYSTSEDMKSLNKLANIGVGQALAGVSQPFKQIIPVAVSTFINTKGKLELGHALNPDKVAFIDNSGYSIANRGRQSQAEIESVNKLIEKSGSSIGAKSLKFIEKANELQLKYLLEKPDVFIAKASWLTYYQEALAKEGVDVKNLDYKTHELNEDAANYAQRQVDRQQNISDHDLAGRLFTDKSSYAQLFTKMLMPFSSFRMNASAKFGADMITLKDKTASKEDKAIARRSIAGYAAEMAIFRAISIGSALLIGGLAKKYLGKDETDEEYKKRKDNLLKGAKTSVFTDLFSPIPVLDAPVQQLGAEITKTFDKLMGTDIAIYDVPKKDFLKEYGTLGISLDRIGKLWTLGNLAATGKYTDDFGKEKQISQEDMEALRPLIPMAIATDIGLAPVEINSAINNAVKFSKTPKKEIDKKMLKERYPEIYERMYGEGTQDNRMKELKKEIEERKKRD